MTEKCFKMAKIGA